MCDVLTYVVRTTYSISVVEASNMLTNENMHTYRILSVYEYV